MFNDHFFEFFFIEIDDQISKKKSETKTGLGFMSSDGIIYLLLMLQMLDKITYIFVIISTVAIISVYIPQLSVSCVVLF